MWPNPQETDHIGHLLNKFLVKNVIFLWIGSNYDIWSINEFALYKR